MSPNTPQTHAPQIRSMHAAQYMLIGKRLGKVVQPALASRALETGCGALATEDPKLDKSHTWVIVPDFTKATHKAIKRF